jgi:glycosyltransferase involved in cell wall biosynthesis
MEKQTGCLLYQINNVCFKGHVANVAEIWKENQLLILPSRMEGQSLALIEAMWCCRGSVVTDVGGAKELLTDGENGFIAASATYAALDQTLERAWQLRDSWDQIGKNAGEKIREKYKAQPIPYFATELKNVIHALTS